MSFKKVETMKKEWICRIEKTYSEDDYVDQADAEKQFINDIANSNFEIYTEEVEVDEE